MYMKGILLALHRGREEEGGRKIYNCFAFLHCSSTTMHNKAVKASILIEITGANNTYGFILFLLLLFFFLLLQLEI